MARLYAYKITLSNTTSTATPAGLQVRLNINFASLVSNINADLGNIRFSSDQAGKNLLFAWLESAPQGTFTQSSSLSAYTSSNVWVNLGNNIIPANGSLNIYMHVLSNGTEFDGIFWGANPLWTSTYGQYDNGVRVFNNYWNFAGTSVPFGLSTYMGAPTINNGYHGTSGTQTAIISSYSTTSAFIFEDYGYENTFPSGYWGPIIAAVSSSGYGNGWVGGNVNDVLGGTPSSDYAYGYVTTGYTSYSYGTNVPYGTTPHIFGVAWSGSGNATYYLDYTQQANTYPMQSTTNYMMVNTGGANFLVYWLRNRIYPPDGVNPVLVSIQILFVGNYTSNANLVTDWETLKGKPYITVSGKGISNGLSNIPNDGADFGPDTPGTTSDGLQEAWNYAVSVGVFNPYVGAAGAYEIPVIRIVSDITISAPVTFSGNGKMIADPIIEGNSSMSPYIFCAVNNAYTITYDPNSFNYVNFRIQNVQPVVPKGYSPSGFVNIDFTGSPNTYTCTFESYNIDISNSGWMIAPLYLNYFFQIFMYNYETYGGSGTYPSGYFYGAGIYFMGGVFNGAAYFTGPTDNYNMLSIINVIFESIIVEHMDNVVIIGNFTAFTYIYLNSDIGAITVIGGGIIGSNPNIPLVNVLTSGDTWTVGSLVVKGYLVGYHGGTGISPYSFVGPGITVLNTDITPVVGSGITVNYPLIVPTTPSVPASGTAQQNTNPYPVNVYIYGGTVTAINYTPDGGTTVQVGTSGPATVHLNPNDSITLTYSATPTWVWVKA
ncbi:MAG: hypothetical protein QW203_07300 [Thermoplasmatales archaeon]